MSDSSALVLPLEAVGLEAIDAVGGKNASLGEMLRALAVEGVRVPGGFALTASAYRLLLSRDRLGDRLETILSGLDAENLEQLQRLLTRGDDGRAQSNQAITDLAEKLSVLAEQMRASMQAVQRGNEEASTGRIQAVQELRSEIKVLTRTLAGIADSRR